MPQPPMLSRRKALQFLTGAPLLPLGSAVSATGLLTACGGGDDGPAKNYVAASFTSMAADRKSTRLNSSHSQISYAVFCLKKKKTNIPDTTKTKSIDTGRTESVSLLS